MQEKTKNTEAITLRGFTALTFSENNLVECFLLCESYLVTLKPPILFLRSIEQRDYIQGVVKLGKNEEEHKNLKTMELMLGSLCSHAVRVLATKGRMFLMTYPRPYLSFPPIRTLRDLCVPRVCRIFCSESMIKSILYQCLLVLRALQTHQIDFTHNDMKAENILLEHCEAPILHYDPRVYSKGVRVVLIDMESVTGAVFPCTLKKSLSVLHQREFGLDDSPWCSFTDIHLVCMELLFACRTSYPSWGPAFAAFLESSIPLHFFKPPYITSVNRLSKLGKISLGKHSLDSMINNSYFDELRVKELLQ